MFGKKLKQENAWLHAELKRLCGEIAQLRKQLGAQELVYRQWSNLLGYDGKVQKNNLTEEVQE